MTDAIQKVIQAFGSPPISSEITQAPFDDDPSHYHRLWAQRANPDANDLCSYTDDLMYQEVQRDLFLCLFPVCLSAWRQDLLASHRSKYLGFAEQFAAALAKHNGFIHLMTPAQHSAVSHFMRHAILAKIDQERELGYAGMGSSPYSWIYTIGSYGTAFPSIDDLWREWWSCGTVGRAWGVLQYASVLMYPDDQNPIFAQWTREAGGGAPSLWETIGHIFDQAWLPENVDFLGTVFSPAYVTHSLTMAARKLRSNLTHAVPDRMAADCVARAAFLKCRIEELIENLSLPLGEVRSWTTR